MKQRSGNQQRSHRGPANFHAFTLPHHQVQSPAFSHTDTQQTHTQDDI